MKSTLKDLAFKYSDCRLKGKDCVKQLKAWVDELIKVAHCTKTNTYPYAVKTDHNMDYADYINYKIIWVLDTKCTQIYLTELENLFNT